MKNKDFAILIPTINRADLLNEALDNYAHWMPNTKIYVLDNGYQDISLSNDNVKVYKMNNYGVAQSWNFLINMASHKVNHYLILNDDIILNRTESAIKYIIGMGNNNTFYKCHENYNWSSFLLSKSVIDKVGKFDENFIQCYYEDNDYAYRLKLANVEIKTELLLNPTHYLNSQSIAKDPNLNRSVHNKAHYIDKWGGEPNAELFKIPYNSNTK